MSDDRPDSSAAQLREPWTSGPWKVHRIVLGPDAEAIVGGVTSDSNGEANARLIALAPEMADLLSRIDQEAILNKLADAAGPITLDPGLARVGRRASHPSKRGRGSGRGDNTRRPIRSFSGLTPFRPADLLEQLRVDEEAKDEDSRIADDLLIKLATHLTRLVDGHRCPRCDTALPDEMPAGSRVTACRCIPICSLCGQAEGLLSGGRNRGDRMAFNKDWGSSRVNVERSRESAIAVNDLVMKGKDGNLDVETGVSIDEDGAGPVVIGPPSTGGWAQFGDDGNDEEDRRGR